MLKNLSFILAVSVVLSACGGSDGDSKRSSSSSSSVVSSSSVSSSVSSEASSSSTVSSVVSSVSSSEQEPSSSSVESSSSSSEESSESSSVASSVSSSENSQPSADLSLGFAAGIEGWFVNGGGTNLLLEHDSLTPALKITPLAWSDTDNWKRQARTELGDTYDFNGATVTAVINVPASYTTDGSLILQLVLQGTGAVYSWNPVTDLVAGDNTIVWEINPETPANAQGITHFGIQLTTPPSSLTILDPFLVKSIEVNFADGGSASSSSVASSEASSSVASSVSAVLTVDFENDDAGTVYGATGWAATDATPTVVTIASITAGSGLPANGSSTKVLRVTVGNWNSSPVVNVSLPGDKTLANYEVKVDAYFPHNTLGLSEANNGYKDLTLMAGATVTGAVQTDNALYHSHVATQGNVDAWTTFTLPVDATKGASLSGDIQLSVGISRSAGTDADAYYLDNIRLVELP